MVGVCRYTQGSLRRGRGRKSKKTTHQKEKKRNEVSQIYASNTTARWTTDIARFAKIIHRSVEIRDLRVVPHSIPSKPTPTQTHSRATRTAESNNHHQPTHRGSLTILYPTGLWTCSWTRQWWSSSVHDCAGRCLPSRRRVVHPGSTFRTDQSANVGHKKIA